MSRARWFLALAALTFALAGGNARPDNSATKLYAFALPPLEMYERLGRADVGPVDPLPAADAKLLAEFWAARNGTPTKEVAPADDAAVTLHLIASGVAENDRGKYLKKFTDLVAAAKKATAGAKTDADKADKLLRFLHKGVMAKGYVENETTLSAVFDKGKFNCVSSSSVYFLVGTRLGLKLQPVLIPGTGFSAGHAAVDLIDGTRRVQIEPTNPDGYDWPAKLTRPGVVAIGPQPDRKKAYDSDGFGLAASIASNLGAEAMKAKPPRPAEAVRHQVIALVLDPTDPTGENNTVAAVINWGKALGDAGKYEEALKVHAFGRAALGSKDIENNYRVYWVKYLDAVFAAGKVEEGLKLVPRAAAAFPKDKDFAGAAVWVERAAHRKADKEGWAAGLAVADTALKHLTGDDAKAVRAWRTQARRLWSQKLLGKGDVDGSLTVLADGLAESPDDKELLAGLAYHTREALAHLDSKKGTPAAAAHFKQVCEKFPKAKEVRGVGFWHADRAVDRLTGAKKFDEALKAADAYAPLAGDRAGELKADVFDAWARALAADGKHEAGLAKYLDGLAAVPKNDRLSNNAVVLIDQWARKPMDKKDWDEAIRIYDVGLKHFPADDHLKRNREYCARQKK